MLLCHNQSKRGLKYFSGAINFAFTDFMATYDFSNALVLVTGTFHFFNYFSFISFFIIFHFFNFLLFLKGYAFSFIGAGSGIGRATSKAFADSGAKVIAADINLDSASETVEGLSSKKQEKIHFYGKNILLFIDKASHFAIKVDVSDEKSVKDLAESILSKYGQAPSIVIHAAGIIFPYRRSIFDTDHDEWKRTIDVNLTGTFLINQTFGRLMRDGKINTGSIINFASEASKIPRPKLADYSVSKAGVVSLTQNFAHELAPLQIRVNAVAPGFVPTPMVAQFSAHMDKIKSEIPQGRVGTVEEVARLCLFLASTESSHITGQTIYMTGGL